MPCNTAHHRYDRLAAQTRLPIVHIADAVATHIRERVPCARCIGILCSAVTPQREIYAKRLGDEWEWLYATSVKLDELVLPGIAAGQSKPVI